ncbi:MAG: hypothetical protein F6K09_21605 [Merismopedia sp. SIO2A8]|nr:hypothetical protein [Merismopedia sp. SIO2A8]
MKTIVGGAEFGECASPGVSPGVYVARLVALKRESPAAKTDEPWMNHEP